MRRELLGHHRLPWVELEDGVDAVLVEVEEGVAVGVPADVQHGDGLGGEASLLRGVLQVGEGEHVLRLFGACEVDGDVEVGGDVLPLGDEALVDGVELVGFARC